MEVDPSSSKNQRDLGLLNFFTIPINCSSLTEDNFIQQQIIDGDADHDGLYGVHISATMNLICWNVQGLRNTQT